jgi:hypothetical protein
MSRQGKPLSERLAHRARYAWAVLWRFRCGSSRQWLAGAPVENCSTRPSGSIGAVAFVQSVSPFAGPSPLTGA